MKFRNFYMTEYAKEENLGEKHCELIIYKRRNTNDSMA